ncbi:9636_t:CDS:10 [Ambispora gerdemannii]|uniref:9636_t:CDS:1 n=1 Tax=Ambispora gerdemannii TaxID=144530 RepID=A0A9N8VYK7_9GLOM|nr:9636_t:CDS:10 [Ambispora gerdemannii]
MVLQVTNPNNVKIYTVSGSGTRSIPDWLARRRKKTLKDDPEWRSRIELIQDFEFPEASIKVKTTADNKFVIATGVYKPQMRVFEFSETSMKFDRHTDAENINFITLSDDWTKSVLLQNDRTIEFHAQGGLHYKTRIPKFGRDLAYHFPTCDLLIAASSSEIYRLNLGQGRFLNSIMTDAVKGVNVNIINPAHQLFGFGTEDGTVEFWDPRSRSRVGLLTPQLSSSLGSENSVINAITTDIQITSMKFRDDGLGLAVGTSSGHILLYDIRSSSPWLVKDHQYGYPIKSVHWYNNAAGDKGRGKVISADCKIMKIWDRESGAHFTSVEPPNDINDVCVVPDSGLIFIANEGIQIGAYYIPSLGPAPRWCYFLDNLTEELEENPQENIYENYKFVTRKELTNLGLDHLIGTNLLKAYMHGFFIDLRLYEKAKLIVNPFAYAEYRQRVIKEKIEKERSSRIRVTKKLPKVNKELAGRLLEDEEKKKKKPNEMFVNPLKDNRFGQLFTNPDYQVDENSREFKLLHPSLSKKKNISDEDEDNYDNEKSESENSESDDDDSISSSRSEIDSDEDLITQLDKLRKVRPSSKLKDEPIRSSNTQSKKQINGNKSRKIEMRTFDSMDSNKAKASKQTFGDRLLRKKSRPEPYQINKVPFGGMEMSFKLEKKNKGQNGSRQENNSNDSNDNRRRNRRSASKNTFRGFR